MKNYPLYYLLITLSIIVNSCSEGFKEEYSKYSLVLKEVTAITTPTTDTTPDYTFSSTESGAITYGGSCSSSTTSAISGNNTITLSSLSDGTYADCTIKVSKTMRTNKSETNLSGSLTMTSFTITTTSTDTTAPVIAEVTAVTTPTNDTTPDYTFSSTEAGTITYGGSCSSGTTSATTDNNTITFSTLDNGTYSNCTIKVTDSAVNVSNTLAITDFTVTYWQLIARQVDSDNFTDGTNELFSSNARSTFLENDNDSSSSTFMSIGNLNKSYYADNGTYKFKLVWDGMQVDSLDNKSVTWTQTSWLDNTTITGFEEISNSGFSTTDTNVVSSLNRFTGLGKSGSNQCVIDGNGSTSNWWNCVGAINTHTSNFFTPSSTGIPGPLQKIASSMHLYIWVPQQFLKFEKFERSNPSHYTCINHFKH